MSKPYTGLRVLDLTTTMAGSVTTMLLADFGAEVTMAHPPEGHALRGEEGFKVWRRGKTPMVADVRTRQGQPKRAGVSGQDVMRDA